MLGECEARIIVALTAPCSSAYNRQFWVRKHVVEGKHGGAGVEVIKRAQPSGFDRLGLGIVLAVDQKPVEWEVSCHRSIAVGVIWKVRPLA